MSETESVIKIVGERVDEFFGRNALYVSGGFVNLVLLASLARFDVPKFFTDLSGYHSLIVLFLLVVLAVISYGLGFAIREIVAWIRLVTTTYDPRYVEAKVTKEGKKEPSRLSKFYLALRKKDVREEQWNAVDENEVVRKASLIARMPGKNRPLGMYVRAIFLKEICATIGSNGVAASLLLFVLLLVQSGFMASNVLVPLAFLALAGSLCLFSFYHAMRERDLAVELMKESGEERSDNSLGSQDK